MKWCFLFLLFLLVLACSSPKIFIVRHAEKGTDPPDNPHLTAAGQQRITVQVGRSGTFSVALAAGTYHVSGRSPAVVEVSADGTEHETACSQPLVVRLAGQHALKIAVTCIVP